MSLSLNMSLQTVDCIRKEKKLLRRPLKGLADSCDTCGENLGFGENTAIAVEVCEDHFLSQPFTS